ncbi:MAG: bifunctional precorrin-2 dehydrogenase/sirohydrochlorin ferrochelatase [Dehalococcoidales bacterium]
MTAKNNASENIYYPVSLNIRGRKCIVVGGGQVALRKVIVLLEHGANVEVISPELCPELVSLSEKGEILARTRAYREGDMKGAFVAIIATDNSEINRKIAGEAREKAVLSNVVDDAEYCDFIAPSYLRRGGISIAISTSGESPALARKIRTRLEKEFGEEYARLSSLIGRIRAEARDQNIKVSSDGWQEAIDLDLLLELLRNGQEEEAGTTLLNNLKARQG